jgi:succinyl-CoA synthetase beta subunit
MKLFEYEAKAILQKHGIAVPAGRIAKTADEAKAIASELAKPVFLKSQITISGRAKAGGILPANSPQEAWLVASCLLGKTIKGITVNSILVEEKLDIQQQWYASITIDRKSRSLVALASINGGVDIEEEAKISPQKIAHFYIDPLVAFTEADARSLIWQFPAEPADLERWVTILTTLYRVALEYDSELIEINPLVKTASGNLVAVDARLIVDDNALFRHRDLADRNLIREEDTPRESEARKQGFAYIDLDGDIGIVGNGAGLVMATVDLVHLFGGKPANFLDIGGGARVDVIKNGVLLVLNKPEVTSVLVNILGGITRCDIVANGIVEAIKASGVKKPVVVRMMGTNEAEGRDILAQHGISYYPDMEQAIRIAVKTSGAANEHNN